MWPKFCLRLGGVTGAFTALITGALRVSPCCAAPPHPALPIWRVILDGLVVALITILIASVFAILVTHRPASEVLPLALLLAVLIALLISPLGYALGHHLAIATLVGGVAGAIIGWIVCRLLCGGRYVPRTNG